MVFEVMDNSAKPRHADNSTACWGAGTNRSRDKVRISGKGVSKVNVSAV